MAAAGAIILLVRYGRIHLAFAEGWEDEYQIPEPEKMTRAQQAAEVSAETEEEELVKPKRRPAKKTEPKKRTASSK